LVVVKAAAKLLMPQVAMVARAAVVAVQAVELLVLEPLIKVLMVHRLRAELVEAAAVQVARPHFQPQE
jgi:hypothetical protein